MGITGLLPLLKSIHKHTTLKKFAGQTIGIDAYGWLHRGTVACAIELATDKPTSKYVDFAMSRVRMLIDFGVTPYLVFDGDAIPSKAGTNAERRKKREESLAAGLELYRAGKLSAAHQELQKAAGVTPLMARQLIEELKRNNVRYVVAPYEADAQLAYLEQKGIINGVLSEDSDLLVFGVKRLLTKLNQYGELVEIERADFASCQELSLAGWTDAMFRRMAILSGCDYLPNIPKMGLKTAYRYVRKHKDSEKCLRMIQFEGFIMPPGYVESFRDAELTFLHHRVFCPVAQGLVFLNELGPGTKEEDMPFLGVNVDPETAIAVACGDLNPKTKERIQIRRLSRPPLQDTRRQTFTSAADLKPKQSIDSFLKAYRQPLAELDPNSLTPSPSQQRLLQVHRNASWEPRMVSSAPQLRRTNISIDTPDTPTLNADRRAFLARASAISTYQPPKRQRLCSENEDASPGKEVKQSPFFTDNKGLEEASPLAQKRGTKKKARKGAFDIWSDDSITDEALMSLPDVHEAASPDQPIKYPKLPEDGSVSRADAEGPKVESILQASPAQAVEDELPADAYREPSSFSTVITDAPSQAEISQLTNTTSISLDDGIELHEGTLEFHMRQRNKTLRKSFICQSPSQRKSALDSVVKSPESPKSPLKPNAPKTTFIEQSPEKQAATLASLAPDMTAQGEMDETEALPSANLMPKVAYAASPSQQRATAEPQTQPQTQTSQTKVELAKEALASTASTSSQSVPERRPMSSLQRLGKAAFGWKAPASTARSAKSSLVDPVALLEASNIITAEDPDVEVSTTWRTKGSEDLIVPNSDEEDEDEEGEGSQRPKLNLKAFAFTGR